MPIGGGGLVVALMQIAEHLDVLLEPMKCGVSAFSALPTLFFLSGTVMLLHQIVTTSGRSLFWRRSHRDLILQEILLVWLIGQSLRLWWTVVKLISIFAVWLWNEMVMMYPPTSYYDLLNGYKTVPSLPVPILFVLEPATLKNIILMIFSFLPLIFIQNIQNRGNFSHFMFCSSFERSSERAKEHQRIVKNKEILKSAVAKHAMEEVYKINFEPQLIKRVKNNRELDVWENINMYKKRRNLMNEELEGIKNMLFKYLKPLRSDNAENSSQEYASTDSRSQSFQH